MFVTSFISITPDAFNLIRSTLKNETVLEDFIFENKVHEYDIDKYYFDVRERMLQSGLPLGALDGAQRWGDDSEIGVLSPMNLNYIIQEWHSLNNTTFDSALVEELISGLFKFYLAASQKGHAVFILFS